MITTHKLLHAELTGWITSLVGRLRLRRQYADALEVEVALDIAADSAAAASTAARLIYTAEQADAEAGRLLRDTLADGKVDAAEIPALRRSLRHVEHSEAAARDASAALG